MNILGAKLYDPSSAATFGSAASAMAVFDTTNLRITFTVPASGIVRVVIEVSLHGATTFSQVLLGVMNGAAVTAKVRPQVTLSGTALATAICCVRADFVVPGLSPGASLTWDAAWGIETFVASSLLKYGGPANATVNNDFGAAQFQIWDCQPQTTTGQLSVDANGRVDVIKVAGTTQTAKDIGSLAIDASGRIDVGKWLGNAVTAASSGIPDVNVKKFNNLTAWAFSDTDNNLALIPTIPTRYNEVFDYSSATATTFVATADTYTYDDTPKGRLAYIFAPGLNYRGQIRVITGYVASTKTFTVYPAWTTTPGASSQLMVLYGGPSDIASIQATPKNDVADQVWDEIVAGHAGVGSTGAQLAAAGAGGDPWSTALPGAYASGTAGYKIGTDLDATISSRLADSSKPTNFGSLSIDGSGRVDVIKVAGTTQTARDIGASVLLSSGTGTGQLDFTSGVVKANLAQILGTALTETAGLIAAGFKQFFNIGSPTSTMNTITTVTTTTTATNLTTNNDKTGYALSVAGVQAIWDALTSAFTTVGSIGKKLADWTIGTAQTGDSFARIGAPVGASISADIAAVKADAVTIKTVTNALPNAGALTNLDAAISSRLATVGYTAPLDAAGTRSAVGLASANLDTQLADIDSDVTSIVVDFTPVTDQLDDIQAKTDLLTFTGTDVKATLDGETVTASSVTDKTGYSISGVKTTLDALNDVSAASVNAQCDTALADYDAPTHAELVSEIDAVQSDIATLTTGPVVVDADGIAQALLDKSLNDFGSTGTVGSLFKRMFIR